MSDVHDRRDPRRRHRARGGRRGPQGARRRSRRCFATSSCEFDLGADRYLRTGETLPDDELEQLASMDAIFLGAVGDPRVKPGILERDLLLKARFGLDQYVNLRPVVRYPGRADARARATAEDDVNMVVVRENSEGLYAGAGGFHRKGTEHEVAVQESINTRHGVERIVRYAFELAMQPQRRRKAHARAQDERADVRGRPVPAGRRRGVGRVPRRRDRLRARRRRVHLLPGLAEPVRRDRHRQHVRRHHHRPRRDDPGRDGHRRRRQHQSRRRVDVRADRGHGAERHRQGHDQPARRDRRARDAAARSSARLGPPTGSTGASEPRPSR